MVKHFSLLLVALQLVFLGFLLLSGPLVPSMNWAFWVYLLGVVLGFWAVWAMRENKVSFTVEVPKKSKLVTRGPYRLIRHPMYAALIILGWALVSEKPTMYRVAAAAALTLVLILKIMFEEQVLGKHFKEYKHYKRKTKRLVPFFY